MRIHLPLILLCYVVLAHCYPEGAPSCEADLPKHETNKAKVGKAPYTIVASSPKGQTVTVTITGTRGSRFKGFKLSARVPNSSTNIGKFTASKDSKVVTCNPSSNTITHKDSNDKSSVSFKWTAPKDFKGKVEFRGTVVKEFKEFWTNLKSSQVTIK